MNYQIFSDATADFSDDMLDGLPKAVIIPMNITVDGHSYVYGPEGDISVEEFYGMLRQGKTAGTSQINPYTYSEYFRKTLDEGKDLIYLCFSSGLSQNYRNACLSVQELQEEYPDRKIICLDTLCASVGQGFLLREALCRQAGGMGIDELAEWVTQIRLKVCHWFTVDDLDSLRRGGRLSTAAALMGTALKIKPLLHVDMEGHLEAKEKQRGAKKAMASQIKRMEYGWTPEDGKLVVIGHGHAPDKAQELKENVLKQFPDAQIYTAAIGPVIGAHTGPGMLALIFWGTER
ncbi:MAG: DegV family protein [Blautia sp.]|nr:DegV family protein [Blautia sp.]